MTDLCTYDDVVSRMEDIGLASASENDVDNVEIIERKRAQADKTLTLGLTKKVQKVLYPYQTDAYENTPSELVELITTEGKTFLNECAIIYTIRAIFEEGSTRMRFRFQEAGDTLDKVLARWDKMCKDEFESVCPLLTFNQDGDSAVTLMERLMMQEYSSVRVTV